MSKAIEGAALLGGAAIMGAFTLGVGGVALEAFMNTTMAFHAMEAIALAGLSMEAGAIADALSAQRGQNITTRTPAGLRQTSYGTQRLGGQEIYVSSTGSTHNQYNMCIVIASHEVWAIESIYLDGRKVYFDTGSSGSSIRNGYEFGGSANGNDYTGPDGATYNFGGLVYCEARFGDQLPGDVIGGFTANDPKWSATSSGSPYVGGCTYVYLKVEASATMFPSLPEIRFTVHGKPVFDPRGGTTAYSSNWALIVADVLTSSGNTVNQAQLIAAANVCDEQVALAAGGTESRYSCHWHLDTGVSVGDALSTLMSAAAGRLSYIGGEWYIWPAYFQGATASFDADHLTAPMQWSEKRSYRDLFNVVTGTYVAANYPYNVAGNLYDSNRWYNGTIQNTYPYSFQPTNYPQYAADTLHGYASNQYLNEDGGVVLPKEISQPCVLSVSQAQRLAKINLLRNRMQGTGTLEMSLAAYQMQPCDTFNFTFAPNGWSSKLLEVNQLQFRMDTSQGVPCLKLAVQVNETDASVYEWSTSDELTVYDVPASTLGPSYIPAPPTNVTLTSSGATAIVQPDGTVIPRIEVQWTTPHDGFVTQIQMQYQLVGSTSWTDAGAVDVSLNAGYISGVVAGQQYNVQIRSVRSTSAASAWVTVNGFTVSLVLNVQTQQGVGIGSLIGEAFTDGTAAIICEPFQASIGSASVWVTPTPSTDSGLTQGTLYYVYYVDPSFTGGNVTAIATTDPSSFRGKVGYFLIDSIVTPSAPTTSGGSGTSGVRISPSAYHDIGTRTTAGAESAYDGNVASSASISGVSRTLDHYPTGVDITPMTTNGEFVYDGFLATSSTGTATLTVVCACTISGSGSVGVAVSYGSTTSSLFSESSTTAASSYTLSIPSGTPFSSIAVDCKATPDEPTTTGVTNTVTLTVNEIYLDY